jgi:hypothetical protein
MRLRLSRSAFSRAATRNTPSRRRPPPSGAAAFSPTCRRPNGRLRFSSDGESSNRDAARPFRGFPLIALVVLITLPGDAHGRVFRVQLDGDKPRERVLLQKTRCPKVSLHGCSRLAVRDGSRKAALTSFTQRPRFPYGWRVRRVRLLDFTGDGWSEVAWALETSRGTVSSPSLKGVHHWNGRHASRIFRFPNARKPPRGYAYAVFATWRILRPAGGGLPEIETSESLHRRDDPNCCPSAYRLIRHRWNGDRIAPVPGSMRIEPA